MAEQWLTGALVVDGRGGEPQRTDVHVTNGRITGLGQAPAGANGIDLQGCPLDDGSAFADPKNTLLVMQSGNVVKDLR